MRFRPAVVPTVLVLIGASITVNLGFWQLRRHYAQQIAHADFEARFSAVPLDNNAISAIPESLHWHRVHLKGHFTGHEPLLITGRFELGEIGYDIVQPFAIDNGPTVLVNRGWIPKPGWQATLLMVNSTSESLFLDGLLIPVADDGTTSPIPPAPDQPKRWQPDRYAAMTRELGLPNPGFVIVAGNPLREGQQKDKSKLPLTGYQATPKHIGHIEYAGQWFLITVTMISLWIYSGFRRAKANS